MEEKRISEYVKRLSSVSDKIQKKLQDEASSGNKHEKMSGIDFEKMVYEGLLKEGFDKKLITHNTQKFPDFIVVDDESGDKLGIEVKKTDSSKWEVIGGSVYESLKNDTDDTYVIMAKLGGDKPEVRIRKYDDCIADLKVTHSPRFYLDLDLKDGEDYLTKNCAKDLLWLSGDELNRKIRQLLRTQKSTWWCEGGTTAFSELPKDEKEVYLIEGIALFPEVFRGDYQKFTPWLVYNCFVWCGNVRDIFSAGGNKYIDKLGIYVSAVMNRALENTKNIRKIISEMTQEEVKKYWDKEVQNPNDRFFVWIGLVEENLRFSNELISNNKSLDNFKNCDRNEICRIIKKVYVSELRMEV